MSDNASIRRVRGPSPPPRTEPASASACTCFQVRRLARRVTQFYDRSLASCGLRVTQYALLSRLLRRPMAMQALADALDMDRTTLTRNLKPLVEARLVVFRPDPRDARVRLVRLTSDGRARRDRAARLWRRAQDDVERSWGTAEVASLHRLFDGLIDTFADEPIDSTPTEAA